MSDLQRFHSKIEKQGECWIWTSTLSRGLPVFSVKRKAHPAARWIFKQQQELERHELLVPSCGNRLCVNPEHMVIKTQGQINAERKRKGGDLASRTLITAPWRTLSNAELGIESYQFGVAV